MNVNKKKTEEQGLLPQDQIWTGMQFPVLSPEELARQQASVEDRVHQSRGVWWRQARPFFWQPCFNYQPLDRIDAWPSRLRALGGFTHISKEGSDSNGVFRAIVHDNIPQYSLRVVSAERRNKIRNGLALLTVREVRPEELLDQGYEVYLDWRSRVKWGRDKSTRDKYARWIGKVVQQPRRLRLGAFDENRLVAFMLPYACDGSLVLSYIASHSESLHQHPNDVLYHAMLTIGRQTPGIRLAEFGSVSSKSSLDKFKLGYGVVKEFPSYTWINPVLRPLVMPRIRRQYPWLQGAEFPKADAPVVAKPQVAGVTVSGS